MLEELFLLLRGSVIFCAYAPWQKRLLKIIMNDLLIEIGTEELPPNSVQELAREFARGIENGLQKAKLSFKETKPYATPRRLAVLVTDLISKQKDQIIERRGPSWSMAFDKQGKPTKATLGFAKSCGAQIKDLKKLETEKGAWVFYKQKQPGGLGGYPTVG